MIFADDEDGNSQGAVVALTDSSTGLGSYFVEMGQEPLVSGKYSLQMLGRVGKEKFLLVSERPRPCD
jgi:hypothetical protein